MKTQLAAVLPLLLLLMIPRALVAQERSGGETDSAQGAHGSSGEHEATDEHHFHRNVIAGFAGVTWEDSDESAMTLGLDYTRWISECFGIGVGVERAFDDLDFTVYTIPLSYRTGPWKFFAGPGWEDPDGHESGGHGEVESGEHGEVESGGHGKEEEHSGTEFLVRAGIEYAFEVERFEISPKIMVDYVDDDYVVIAGVSFGYAF